jgi:hypothetical protein
MRTLTKTLMSALVAAIFMTSCAGDPTSSNPDIAKLSDVSKKALDEVSKKGCECLKKHGKGLQEFMAEAKPLLADAEKSENPMEVMGKLMGSMMKMKDFGECFKDVDPKGDEATEKAMEEDMKKILGENPERGAEKKKQMEIMNAYFGKNCPSEAKIFADFIKFGEQMENLRKKK